MRKLRTIGFPISTKENERRRAILPNQINAIVHKNQLFFEKNYGKELGIEDEEYCQAGANIVNRNIVLDCDVICDPKVGDAEYLDILKENQTVFGWLHAVQNKSITDLIVRKELTAIAWEDMFENGRHVFWRNNELAGEAAILHAFTLFGKVPYECNVAIIGKGNIARGALKTLNSLGARVQVYDRRTEALLRSELSEYDVVVNGVLWDVFREDHIICKEDLRRMKKKSLIIDISCDKNGGIETSRPTSIEKPTYYVDNVMHYVVDHTPALFCYSVSEVIGNELIKYLDILVEGKQSECKVLSDAIIISDGTITDSKIMKYQSRF